MSTEGVGFSRAWRGDLTRKCANIVCEHKVCELRVCIHLVNIGFVNIGFANMVAGCRKCEISIGFEGLEGRHVQKVWKYGVFSIVVTNLDGKTR